ncbi:MAG: hypothetical protein AMXMBFR84_03800 [Candidatus Hydrogenedentota bacterium]
MTDELHRRRLFIASNIALIATAMSFAIRGDTMGDFQTQFVEPYVQQTDLAGVEATDEQAALAEAHVKARLGLIGTIAFFSFGLTIVFGGPMVDAFGMGMLLRLAAFCHVGGAILTIFSPNYWVLVFATFVVGAGNGLVEAVCNPLIATLYPDEKTHKLTLFHAWFPGGIVIGGLAAYLFSNIGLGWQAKTALLLIPSVIYLFLIIKEKFPATERVAAGLSFSEMVVGAFSRPLFLVLLVIMLFTAATELGPGAWISNIYQDVMQRKEGILAVVWGSILMYILRQFFSKPVHKMSPVLLICVTAPLAAAGLYLFKFAAQGSVVMFFLAATLLYVGVCFWWPTMLGIVSERCPKSGAFGLALVGGAGSFATFFAGPAIGALNDKFGPVGSLQVWAILPVVIFVVFLVIYLFDQSKGGYRAQVEKLSTGE